MSEQPVEQSAELPQQDIFLHLSPRQVELLELIKLREQRKILEQNYRDPADDQVSIRHRIHLEGGIAQLDFLLNYDEVLLQQKVAEKERLLEAQPSQENQPAQFNPGYF